MPAKILSKKRAVPDAQGLLSTRRLPQEQLQPEGHHSPMKLRIALAVAAVALAVTITSPAQANGYPRVDSLSTLSAGSTTAKIAWTGTDYSGPNRYRVSWHERQAPGRTWTSSGDDYGINASPLTLTGLLPGYAYDIDVAARGADGWFGSGAHTVALTTGTQSTTPAKGCVLQGWPSQTTASIRRIRAGQLRVTGYVSYFSAGAYHREPSHGYTLMLLRQETTGGSWTDVGGITGGITTVVAAGKGVFKMVFGGSCTVPYAPSESGSVVR